MSQSETRQRTGIVALRVFPYEKKRLEQMATDRGVDVSVLLREALDAALEEWEA
jgi:predicted DNA-binding protein